MRRDLDADPAGEAHVAFGDLDQTCTCVLAHALVGTASNYSPAAIESRTSNQFYYQVREDQI